MALRFFTCDNPPDCRDNTGMCRKWIACQAQHPWHGNSPFTGPIGVNGRCTGSCDGETPTPILGGIKYLKKTIVLDYHFSQVSKVWVYSMGGWVLRTGTNTRDAHIENGTTIDRITGCKTSPDTGPVDTYVTDSAYSDCSGAAPGGYFVVQVINCTIGGSPVDERPMETWVNNFGYDCNDGGRFYTGNAGACGGGFPGGTESDLSDYLSGDLGMTVTFDAVTATHIGVHAVYLPGSPAGYHYTGTYPPGTEPPALDPDGNPWAEGASFCASVDITCTFDLTADLGIAYSFADLEAVAYALLANYNLTKHPWKDMPVCFAGQFTAIYGSTLMPILRYNGAGCCVTGMADLGTTIEDCTFDGSVVQTFIGPESPLGSSVPLTWGAFQRYDPNTPGDSGGQITVQKWAMRQGSYLPYGYQEGRPKTWKWLRLASDVNLCSGAAEFFCDEEIGSKGFIMGFTPNGEFKPGHNFWFPAGYTFIPERGLGRVIRMATKDADVDRWPDDCTPNAFTSDTYVEPEGCVCNCGDGTVCPLPTEGQCPFEPDDNYPPFGP